MRERERAEDLQEYIERELSDLTKTLESDKTAKMSDETKQELSAIYGSELVNRFFGKRDFTTLPELSLLATSSLRTRALFVAELKIWERLMRNALSNKNKAVSEAGDKFIDKTASLYEQLQEVLAKQSAKDMEDINKAHKQLVQVLEEEAKAVKDIHDKGERLRSTDKDSIKRAIEEHRTQINQVIKKAVETKIDEIMKEVPYDEYSHKEYEVNKLYCLGYFFFGSSLVAFGFYAMKLFSV